MKCWAGELSGGASDLPGGRVRRGYCRFAGVVLSEYRAKPPNSKATGSYRAAQEGTQRR